MDSRRRGPSHKLIRTPLPFCFSHQPQPIVHAFDNFQASSTSKRQCHNVTGTIKINLYQVT